MAGRSGFRAKASIVGGVIGVGMIVAFQNASSPKPLDTSLSYDYLIMNVCTDDPHGKVIAASPLDNERCLYQRNIHSFENPPYYAQAWGAKSVSRRYTFPSPDRGSDGDHRYLIVLGWTDHTGSGTFSSKDNVSAMTVQQGYASDLGSTGGAMLSVNLGADYVDGSNPKAVGIGRFAKSWLFFDEDLAASDPNGDVADNVRFTTSSEEIVAIDREEFLEHGLPTPDPSKLGGYFSLQVHKTFAFGPDGQFPLDTVVENKYAGRDQAGLSYGHASAMERVYFTKQLGETRWEAWKRDDDLLLSEKFSADDDFQAMCGRPAQMLPENATHVGINSHLTMGPVAPFKKGSFSSWSQNITSYDDDSGGMKTHTWYLTACADWSDIKVLPVGSNYMPLHDVKESDLVKSLLGLFVP